MTGLADRWSRLDPSLRREALSRARDRAPVPAIDARDAWSSVDRSTARAILAEAAGDRRAPWPHAPLSDYARYWRDGVRTAYEGTAGQLRRRASAAVFAAALTGRTEDLDEAADGLWFLCEQSSWCWAAHERFATERQELVPDPDHPFLDLGAAETVAILAWADLVLAPALDERVPGLRSRLRREAELRVLQPFQQDRTWHWLGLDGALHNWNPWIHGHVLTAALFLVDEPRSQEAIVGLVLQGLDRYLAAQPADGGCDEGFAYWWNGPARLAEALHLLDAATNGAFAPWACEPLPELARYPQRTALGAGWFVNVGDGPARPPADQPWHVLHRWGRLAADPQVSEFAASHRVPGTASVTTAAGLGRALLGSHDPHWTSARAERVPLPPTSWLPDVQLLVSKIDGNSVNGLALSAKGGHNGENHNHNDVGSYIVAVDGIPVIVDLGQPTYTAVSFSERRYEQWVTRSEWHNVPVVNGTGQQAGDSFRAREVTFDTRADGDTLRLQLAGAYPGGCRSWQRALRLDRAAPAVTIADHWVVEEPGEVRLHHVLAGEPLRHDDGVLLIRSLGGRVLRLAWDPRSGRGGLAARTVDDPLLRDVWGQVVHRLVIVPPAGPTGSFTLTVTEDSDAG